MKSQNYEEFVEKFKPKLTTDDCYTPPEIYEDVKNWAEKEYQINGPVIRPFWPGADYQSIEYPPNSCVIDNPPFSILTEIIRFYMKNNTPFLLFAPSLRLSGQNIPGVTFLACGENVIFENGAVVGISFVTNMDEPEIALRTVPDLAYIIRETGKKLKKTQTRPAYSFPDHVLTAAMAEKYAQRGIDFIVKRKDCRLISKLESMGNKTIYGGGLLLSERAAAERAAAREKIIWPLSPAEIKIIKEDLCES